VYKFNGIIDEIISEAISHYILVKVL